MEAVLIRVAGAGLAGEVAVYGAAFAGVCLHYAASVRAGASSASLRAFGRHLLPADLLRAAWTRQDIAYAILDKLLMALVFPSVAGMVVGAGRLVQLGLADGVGPGPALPQSLATLAAFLVAALLIRDFAAFYVHLLQHRIPLLWAFHKVHHAPESLIPASGRRLHPLDQFLGMAAEAPLLGLLVGLYAWLTQQTLDTLIPCAVGCYALANIVTFAPLRHSHIDLRLGALERILLSPAHHRLHHSVEPAHWDRNFAALFPIWDRLFGTLAEPPPASQYRLGLPNGDSARYATLLACYIEPFRQIRADCRRTGLRALLRPRPVAGRRPSIASTTSATG